MSGPERIWATGNKTAGSWNHEPMSARIAPEQTEYVRADLATPTDERVKRLEDENAQLKHALVVWDAAHRTGRNEPLQTAFEIGKATLVALRDTGVE